MPNIEEGTKTVETERNGKDKPRSTRCRCIMLTLLILIALAIIIVLIVHFTNIRHSKQEEPKLSRKIIQYTHLAGSNIQLKCPLHYLKEQTSWLLNDKTVSIGNRMSISSGALSIQNIQPSDGGNYICVNDGRKSKSISVAVVYYSMTQLAEPGSFFLKEIVEVILNNVTSQTGEGPHWEQATESLLFVDIFAYQLHRWNAVTGKHEVETFDGNVGFVVPYKDGGYIVAIQRSLVHFDFETKKIKKLHEVEFGTFNAINDGKVDPKGRVWTGTYGNFTDLENPEYFYKGSMYMMDLDGSLHKKWENITISNGFAWTSDNKTMYYVDSIPRKVYKFDYNVETGEIDYRGVAIDFINTKEDFHVLGYPDGVAMDTEGMIWIACFDAAKVVRFNPKTGERLRIIDFKGIARKTTSCCFGGPNHDVLYVTSGGAATDVERMEDKYSGSVFRVTGLGVQGFPGRIYQGVV